ncbi:hypothetical protein Taro_025577 [Colocasia esculenta]|uniref:Uncharacterized protein n=1 Tax=Colocasia esculenta TaxID=4460 RepID=A0A843VI04_COLES|nr:hypothetical protein [Colocasia esculenta]
MVRYSPPTLGHSARLATDLSVGVSPRRAHSAGFAGQVGTSGAASHVGQARLKGIHWLGRFGSIWREESQRSPRLEPSYVTITATGTIQDFELDIHILIIQNENAHINPKVLNEKVH